MNFIGIIPARYESSRFPGRPLAMLENKPMIQWVVENAQKSLNEVWVATDDDRILKAVSEFGGKVLKTDKSHNSGTDRCAEAARILTKKLAFDVVINIQGDEPFIESEQIELLKSCFEEETQIATLIKQINNTEELFNPNRPKVVTDKNRNALYFSRSPIPFYRGEANENWVLKHKFWAHIGMYAYRADVLQIITKLSPGSLETSESLEQLRWLENGFSIKTAETSHQSIGIDTPEDLQNALYFLKKNKQN